MNDRRRLGSVAAWLGAGVLLAGVAMVTAGPLDPPAGPPGSTGKTTDEIYGAIQGIAGSVAGQSGCGPTIPGTPRTHAPTAAFDATSTPGPTPAFNSEVLAFEFVGENISSLGGGGTDRYSVTGVEIVRNAGANSNYFHRMITAGKNFPNVKVKLGTTASPLSVDMKLVFVERVSMEMVPKCDGTHVLVERITLQPGEIRVTDSSGTWNWSIVENQGGE